MRSTHVSVFHNRTTDPYDDQRHAIRCWSKIGRMDITARSIDGRPSKASKQASKQGCTEHRAAGRRIGCAAESHHPAFAADREFFSPTYTGVSFPPGLPTLHETTLSPLHHLNCDAIGIKADTMVPGRPVMECSAQTEV